MIRRTLIIGLQEFVKYVTRRGFIISLLMIPAIMVLAIAVPRFTATHPRTTVMTVVDLEGGYSAAIAAAAARDQTEAELSALADYAHANIAPRVLVVQAPELKRLFDAPKRIAAIREFAASGGWQAAFAKLSPLIKRGAPAFDPPKPSVVLIPPPSDLSAAFAAGHSGVASAYLEGTVGVTAQGRPGRLDAIVVIPKSLSGNIMRDCIIFAASVGWTRA